MKFINKALSIRCLKILHQKKCETALRNVPANQKLCLRLRDILITIAFPRFCIMYTYPENILITIEFPRFCNMYLFTRETITSGPAGNYHTQWV